VPRSLSGAATNLTPQWWPEPGGYVDEVPPSSPAPGARPVVLASNRGPLSFAIGDGDRLETKRGGGGLITVVGGALEGSNATWIAAALSDADREAASRGVIDAEGYRVRTIVVEDLAAYYDVISNGTLWFVHHGLFDTPRRPRFDRAWHEAWDAYRRVNETFARAIAEDAPEGADVLVQDYHLALVGPRLCAQRDDVRTAWFGHTPFCWPDGLRPIPDDAATAFVAGIAGHHACGFHSSRWAEAFTACARQREVTSSPFVAPLGADVEDLARVAESAACSQAVRALDGAIGDRRLLVRVDRIELSKNLLRGFLAFDDLLHTRPEWRGRVVFGAFVYPSRESLPEYLAYHREVEALAARINDAWATPEWTPIIVDTDDYFPRSCAALRRYDVLLVNPVRDGLNLVAKEGSLLNERDGVLALSREAGVWDELEAAVLDVNPFDVSGTADVLAEALAMEPHERARRAEILCKAAGARTPHDWLDDQLRAARVR